MVNLHKMKRKTLIFVALCILGFSSREIQAIPYKTIPIHNMGRSMPHEYNKIELLKVIYCYSHAHGFGTD